MGITQSSNNRKFLQLKKFPLETEALVRFGQYQMEEMSREELEAYAKQSFMLLSQLTHYTEQLLQGLADLEVDVISSEFSE